MLGRAAHHLAYIILMLSLTHTGSAQTRDTSFTVYSAFQKAKKNYPDISIAQVQPFDFYTTERRVYCTYGERQMHADIYHPATRKNWAKPAILLIHGGGWRSGERSQQIPMAQALAARGFEAIVIEYRLATEAKYPAALHDIKAAIRWTRAHAGEFFIDPNKIVVLGCSAGGQLAALAGTTNDLPAFEDKMCNAGYSSAVQAIVDVDGILAFIHPESGEGDDSKSMSAATYWFGYSKTERPALWNEASPLNHVNKNTPPIIFINSSVARMHAGRDDMINKLDSLHIYHETKTFPDAPHPFWLFNPWFEPTVKYTVDFLNKVFKK